MPAPTHVWLLNMGGPDKADNVQPFLQRLLGDPDLVQFPVPWLQWIFAWVISRVRARKVLPSYEYMGGASPQLAVMESQTRKLNRILGDAFLCRPVFRYWGPSADEAAAAVGRDEKVVLLSMYPQRCGATTTSSLRDAHRALAGRAAKVVEVDGYATDTTYIEAVSETLRQAITELPNGCDYEVLFSAHGLPEARAKRGDPYPEETRATVDAVVKASRLHQPHHLSFQSRVGVTRWLQPSTLESVQTLGARGVKNLIVVPVSFTSDHIETLVELDQEVAAVAREAGIEQFVRAPTVGTRPTFLRCLAEQVRAALREV